MTKGILLLATGWHQYGQMAVALTAQIKRHWPTIQVAIACNEAGFAAVGDGVKLFDQVIEVKDELFQVRGKNSPHRAKVFIDQLTPFDKTLYLDVDTMLWPGADLQAALDQPDALKIQMEYFEDIAAPLEKSHMKPNQAGRLYSGLQGLKGGISNTLWFDDFALVDAYKLTEGHIPSYNTSFILFDKKDKLVKKFFEKARQIYDNPNEGVPFASFAGDMPDEYAFDIASVLLGIKFDYERYWPLLHDKPPKTYGMADWAKISIGFTMYGRNYQHDNGSFVNIYDQLNNANATYWHERGIRYIPYKFTAKAIWNKQRNTL